ncbi:MaoC family dehydratase N-terminal domain-containing protein [Nocardioides sp. cx-169]|uniref:FAS1-like dehydratase domain-containing protein n=1 Tax=Nocardioides sp. cx-169 TaxID=2899080 RepID=UPI001E405E68|nr:MaoC family dehydratase N-terminal domain-containing protein [Nocardioides sp. cx-169]MCD4533010.1 MaoC family dehydratase N-terminal domain-containing protein [Nocardioides sp. cx-169]
MPIERGKVREYARATGAARPAYLEDPEAPIPPTFLATVTFWTTVGRTLGGPEVRQACAEIGIEPDVRSLLSLEQEYVIHGRVPRAGEELRVEERLHGIETKHGRRGPMVLVRFVLEFSDDHGLRAECHYTSAFVRKDAA